MVRSRREDACHRRRHRQVGQQCDIALSSPTQNDSKRATEGSAANKRTERIRSMAATVRRYDQRNTSDKNSAYAALISNFSEKERSKDVEPFNDILRTFINKMNKFESRFGAIRDEEKMLAVKKLMPQKLPNYRNRGTTMSYSREDSSHCVGCDDKRRRGNRNMQCSDESC